MIMTRFNDSSLTSVRHRRILIWSRGSSKHVDYISRRPSLAITGPALDDQWCRRLTLNYHMYSSLLEIDIRPGLGFGIFELGTVCNFHI
jgi:hypothetical protein